MTKNEIKEAFLNYELSYIDAICELEKLGITSFRAEEIVEDWFENRKPINE